MTGLTVTEPYQPGMDAVLLPVDEEVREQSRLLGEAMEQVKMAAQGAVCPAQTIREVLDQPYRAIIDAAQALAAISSSQLRMAGAASRLCCSAAKVLTHSTGARVSLTAFPGAAWGQSTRSTRIGDPLPTLTLAPAGQSGPATRQELSPTRMRP